MRLAIIDVVEERGRILLEMSEEVFLKLLEEAMEEHGDVRVAFYVVANKFKNKSITL